MTLADDIQNCKNCGLCKLLPDDITPIQPLTGINPTIMLITDNPRNEELVIGEPISVNEQMFLKRFFNIHDFYITNLVKCNPIKVSPKFKVSDRQPKKQEIQKCSSLIDREIESMMPKYIVCCGKASIGKFFQQKTEIPIMYNHYKMRVNSFYSTVIPSYSIKYLLNRSKTETDRFVTEIRKILC